MIFEIDGDKLVLTAPNSFTLRIVQERFLPEITKRALPFFAAPPHIELRIEKKGSKSALRSNRSRGCIKKGFCTGSQGSEKSQQA